MQQWQAKLESVEPDVARVLAEEREETALRKAEMEANKAQVGQSSSIKKGDDEIVPSHAMHRPIVRSFRM